MKVVYSIGARFAGGGIGTTSYHAVRGLHRHELLHLLLCGSYRPSELPVTKLRAMGIASRLLRKLATYDAKNWVWFMESVIYDWWACHHLEPVDLFHVWANYGLRSLQRARELGMLAVVERASTHPLYQVRLLDEEYTRWGISYARPAAMLRRAIQELALADYVLIPSDFVRKSFVSEGFPEKRLLQIPFGVDIDRFHPTVERNCDPFRVLFMGQVGIRKGIPYLLEAWRKLGWRDAELWLVGPVEVKAQSILDHYRNLPGLKLMGHKPDPVRFFQGADAFAFPTIEEGSALVTYEALSCGLPGVTTQNAGSVVRDGVEGYLVPIQDSEAIADRLERLRANPRLREDMKRAARKRAKEFTWEAYGDSLSQTLSRVVLDHNQT